MSVPLLHGVETRRFTIDLSGYGRVLGVKFRPGGFGAFTGRDVGSLRDQVLPLHEVFGDDAARMAEMVLDEDDDQRRIEVVEAFLAPRIPEPSPSYELVLEVVRTMFEDRAVTSVAEVARRFDVSARTLQRLFRRYVGVGPKWVLRRYRIHDAAAIDSGDAPDLATLSAELGWFDQVHFSHEFKDVLGLTPSEYAVQAADVRVAAPTA
jgi:AraC-like DNA-binding protein